MKAESMKKLLPFASFVLVAVLIYAGVAFVVWEPSPAAWSADARLVMVFTAGTFGIAAAFITAMIGTMGGA